MYWCLIWPILNIEGKHLFWAGIVCQSLLSVQYCGEAVPSSSSQHCREVALLPFQGSCQRKLTEGFYKLCLLRFSSLPPFLNPILYIEDTLSIMAPPHPIHENLRSCKIAGKQCFPPEVTEGVVCH
ncbi:MAG: hypothetical protein ATN31_08190 [Candidatus Epulonipiscioides saccharophilum]|nr:MAG: hypothetical protein ATN31_08190 [Epulopiscium sp. AS2M-Bin001]